MSMRREYMENERIAEAENIRSAHSHLMLMDRSETGPCHFQGSLLKEAV